MKGLAKFGVLIITVFALALMITSVPFGSGAHLNITVSTYPTNYSNVSTSWAIFNFTFNTSVIHHCVFVFRNASASSYNFTGTKVGTNTSTAQICEVNVTFSQDTAAGMWFNITPWANDTVSGVWYEGGYTHFRIDTIAPQVRVIRVLRRNDTFNKYAIPAIINSSSAVGSSIATQRQDHLRIIFNVSDNSTIKNSCKIIILRENTPGTFTNVANSTTNRTTTWGNSLSTLNKEYSFAIPASEFTEGKYQGRFWVYPHCTDASDNIGQGNQTEKGGRWGVVTPVAAATWTPLGIFDVNGSLSSDDLWNYTWNLSWANNISTVALWHPGNKSLDKQFLTHTWNQSTYSNQPIDIYNNSALFVYSTNGWTLLRMNTTYIESGINLTLFYNNTGATNQYAWTSLVNLKANTSLYVANLSLSCGEFTKMIAWFNSTKENCLGGCWETYSLGTGNPNNDTVIPFGTTYWILTTEQNVTMTSLTPNRMGQCAEY